MRRKQTGEMHDMLVIKYRKTDSICFISHIDLLRHTERVLRRAHIDVRFSQGFNPHPLMYFSPPLALGVASEAEYLTIDSDMDEDYVLSAYNKSVPDGQKADKIFKCSKNPNLQAKVVCADYVFPTKKDFQPGGDFFVEYQKKGETIRENVADKIYAVFKKDGNLVLRLASGMTNLRPDRVLATLNTLLHEDMSVCGVKKIAQYVDVDGVLTDVDEFLKTV